MIEEPPPGAVVIDGSGDYWERQYGDNGHRTWMMVEHIDWDLESWIRVNEFGPVTIVSVPSER